MHFHYQIKKLFSLTTTAVIVAYSVVVESSPSSEVCPFRITSYSEENCRKDAESSTTFVSIVDDKCQFIQDGLYRAYCDSSENLVLQPCVVDGSSATSNITYVSGKCLPGVNDPTKLQVSFQVTGNCSDNTTLCPEENGSVTEDKNKQVPTNTPTSAPTIKPIVSIKLPSPPLPPNEFGDQMRSLELFHEMVYLSSVVYKIMGDVEPTSVFAEKYKLHLWSDGFSTDFAILTTETTKQENGKIYVVFRGTDETLDGDWITNANFPQVPYGPPGGIIEATVDATNLFGEMETFEVKVHKGFNTVFSGDAYNNIINIINPFLERTDEDGKPYYNNTVHFAGHSLGGANAQLLGTYFAVLNPEIETYITTLGAPKQGNYAYKLLGEYLPNLNVWRLVYCRDVVPRVPLIRYYHSGHIMWKRCIDQPWGDRFDVVDKDNLVQAYYRQAGDSAQGYADLPQSWMIQYDEPTLISDHFAGTYLKWIENILLNNTDHLPPVFEKATPMSSPPVESPNMAPSSILPESSLTESDTSSGVQHRNYLVASLCIILSMLDILPHYSI